jgi:hypothetical protein
MLPLAFSKISASLQVRMVIGWFGDGGIGVTRLEWQQLAERWLVDAKSLLDDKRWSAAYYLAGYAVECGLKACVLVRVAASPEVLFDDKKFSEKCWTHSVLELVKMADLEAARTADSAANPALGKNGWWPMTGARKPATGPRRIRGPRSSMTRLRTT